MTKDLLLYESGDGGEMRIINNDLALSETLYQSIYIALFGGNVEANTTGNELQSQERFDYWANDLIHKDVESRQFNSITERTLNTVALNSSGRIEILRAVETDLSYLKTLASFDVSVFLDTNKVIIEIKLSPLQNQEERVLQMIWDNARNELIINEII